MKHVTPTLVVLASMSTLESGRQASVLVVAACAANENRLVAPAPVSPDDTGRRASMFSSVGTAYMLRLSLWHLM